MVAVVKFALSYSRVGFSTTFQQLTASDPSLNSNLLASKKKSREDREDLGV
jgi:hypothetical protein